MTNTLEHLLLLSQMENSSLSLSLTGEFSEEALDQACKRIKEAGVQEQLGRGNNLRVQIEIIENPEFIGLYQALGQQETGNETISSMIASAANGGEKLTQYPWEQVLEAAELDISPALKFEYMKYYLPYVKYEEEEQVIVSNLQSFRIEKWKSLSALTEPQRDMMRLPFLASYLLGNWREDEKEALELLEKNIPFQRILALLYQQGVTLVLEAAALKDLQWFRQADVGKFQRLMEVFEYDADDLSAFIQCWFENRAGQYDLDWFISQPAPICKERRAEILCNRLSYLNTLYSGRLHLDFNEIRHFQVPVLIYAVEHRKEHFLELVDKNRETFLSLGRYSLLFEDGFREHCNLNSLSAKNLQACDATSRGDSLWELLEDGKQYTFEEMHLLWRQEEAYVQLYVKLAPLSVDRRLLTLRQLLKRDLVAPYVGDSELEQLAQCLLQKPFSEWYQSAFGHIRGLTRQTAVQLLQHYKEVRAFVPDLQTEADAVFIVCNLQNLVGQESWQQIRASIMEKDQNWKYLKDKLVFSDEFVTQNRQSITEFLLRGGGAMVRAFLDGLAQSDKTAVEALRRVLQAELMGQFYKLKYFTDDLRREIHYPIRELQENTWKRNLSLKQGAFRAEEVDDFYYTLQLGELPRRTCLSYQTGAQRDCLLAAFDSNKKMILIWKGDNIVARACIRLTKGAFQKPKEYYFSFADLTQKHTSAEDPLTGEKLVLFLERIYTSYLNDHEEHAVRRMAVILVTQKAMELGAVAVLARQYAGCYGRDEYICTPFYMYISKSKNGHQYLDSLDGAAVTSHREQYVEKPFLVEQAALHTAEPPNRKEEEYE